MSKPLNDLSLDALKQHPILNRVLDRMERQLADGNAMPHTAHNSHYSSLPKDEAEAEAEKA